MAKKFKKINFSQGMSDIQKAVKFFENIRDEANVVLQSGFGTNEGENGTLYRNRKLYAEIAVEAIKKQIPRKAEMKVMEDFEEGSALQLCCPFCGKSVINYWNKEINPPHCMMCGQSLDWS